MFHFLNPCPKNSPSVVAKVKVIISISIISGMQADFQAALWGDGIEGVQVEKVEWLYKCILPCLSQSLCFQNIWIIWE